MRVGAGTGIEDEPKRRLPVYWVQNFPVMAGVKVRDILNGFQGIAVVYGRPKVFGEGKGEEEDKEKEEKEKKEKEEYDQVLKEAWDSLSSLPVPPPPPPPMLQPHPIPPPFIPKPQSKISGSNAASDHWDEVEGAHDEVDYMEDEKIHSLVTAVRRKLEGISQAGRTEKVRIVGERVKAVWDRMVREREEREEGREEGEEDVTKTTLSEGGEGGGKVVKGPRGVSNQPAWMTEGIKNEEGGGEKRGREEGGGGGGGETTTKKIKLSEANRDIGERKERIEMGGESQKDIRERNRREDQERKGSGKGVIQVPVKSDLDKVGGWKLKGKEDMVGKEGGVEDKFLKEAFETKQMRTFVGGVIERYLGEGDDDMREFVVSTGRKKGEWKKNMRELWEEMEVVLEEETGGMMEEVFKGAVWIADHIKGGGKIE
ncbi:hypothetical protein TrCOL_g3863 [Triparma columacea]|uniref:Uncharacterized protein n=1 Tax=Triparma columacea TaxID=722753 RepID=A0A9W7GFN5_9STRA|nr:hypothetical protein TrCOL_g3863 [Triparma columacea]